MAQTDRGADHPLKEALSQGRSGLLILANWGPEIPNAPGKSLLGQVQIPATRTLPSRRSPSLPARRAMSEAEMALLGFAYKGDVGDTRDSPVMRIIPEIFSLNNLYYES